MFREPRFMKQGQLTVDQLVKEHGTRNMVTLNYLGRTVKKMNTYIKKNKFLK
jgi:hypothetical protein